MPTKLLYDIAGIDLDQVLFGLDEIRRNNPQRGDMEQLTAIVWAKPEEGKIIGRRDIRADEFWVPGHIPGRPLFPGVLMIEAAAQVASFYTRKYDKWTGFIGFGGVDDCKFRAAVTPPTTMYLIGLKIWERHKRIRCNFQGIVAGQLAFEVAITGTEF